jgi:hypothetical protein
MAANEQQQRSAPGGASQPGQFGGYGAGDDAFGRGTGARGGSGETGSGGYGPGRQANSQAYGYEPQDDRAGDERRGTRMQGGGQPHEPHNWDPRLGGAGRRAQMSERPDRLEGRERGDFRGRPPESRPLEASASGSMAALPGLHYGRGEQGGREERMRSRSSDVPGLQGSAPAHRQFDADYHQWRAEQMRKLDEDYEQWRKERYQKFSEEFDAWRKQRGSGSGRDPQASYSGESSEGRAQREARQARETRDLHDARLADDQRVPNDGANAAAPGSARELPDAGSASAFGNPPPRSAASQTADERPPQRESTSRSGGILSSLLGTDKNK